MLRIRLRVGNLEVRAIDRDTLCYVGIMKDVYMVAAFTYFTEPAYASDQVVDPAFRTDDLLAFILLAVKPRRLRRGYKAHREAISLI